MIGLYTLIVSGFIIWTAISFLVLEGRETYQIKEEDGEPEYETVRKDLSLLGKIMALPMLLTIKAFSFLLKTFNKALYEDMEEE